MGDAPGWARDTGRESGRRNGEFARVLLVRPEPPDRREDFGRLREMASGAAVRGFVAEVGVAAACCFSDAGSSIGGDDDSTLFIERILRKRFAP